MRARSDEAVDFERKLTEYTEALKRGEDIAPHHARLDEARVRIVDPMDAIDAEAQLVLMFACAVEAGAASEAARVYACLPEPLRDEIDAVDAKMPGTTKIWERH